MSKIKSFFKDLPLKLKGYSSSNILFLVFVGSALINSFLLRVFTVRFTYNFIKPVLADMAAVLIIGMFGYLIKPKRRFIYYMIFNCIFVFLCITNSIYYTNYKSFASVSLISTASQLGGVMDAVTKNIMEAKDLTFFWSVPALIATYVLIKKKKPDYFEKIAEKKKGKKYFLGTFTAGLVFAACAAIMFTGTDYSRLRKQWNREYTLATFGLYTYQISDTVQSIYSKINMMFGYDESKEQFTNFYTDKDSKDAVSKQNDYSNIFKGKNMLVIHCESMQNFMLGSYMNGEEVTPNLNKLASEGLYFSNFYAQESVGTSSDSEFTFSTSLMPASTGTVAINYWDRDYTSIQKLVKDKGYFVFSMHGNNGSYWNRMNLHNSLGYDKFFNYSTDFDIDETIGLGLSDKSFFRQAVPKIKEIDQNNKNWYGALIMLTNHTPFTDIERVSDFAVDFKYKKYDAATGLYEEVSAPFLEGTKLGSYFKSVHYADEALGQLLQDMDDEGLLDDTVVILYGDHDAKVKEEEYDYYFNYNPFTEEVLDNMVDHDKVADEAKKRTEAAAKEAARQAKKAQAKALQALRELNTIKSDSRYTFPLSIILTALAFTVLVLAIVTTSVRISEITTENSALKRTYDSLTAEEDKLRMELEVRDDLRTVENLAKNEYGMVKQDQVERYYLKTYQSDRIELVEETEEEKSGVLDGIASLFRSIGDRILSFFGK